MRAFRPGALLAVMVAAAVAGGGAASDEPHPECTFDPHALRSPREIWHQLSATAEAVAPSSGRHRAVNPPAAPPQTFTARNFIDSEIFGKMVNDKVRWTAPSTDEEFLRRVTLDITGAVPDSDTVKSFVADTSPGKRDAMIDKLLASDGYADKWTMWLGDRVQNVAFATNANEYPTARNFYYKYLHDSVAGGKPYDQIVREIIAGTGDSFLAGPPVYWVRQIQLNGPIQDTYDNLSAATGQQFLGLPLICLSCHSGAGHLEQVNTSLARRTRAEFWGNAAFFARTSTQAVNNGSLGVEYGVNDNTTGEYRLNTTTGNKTPRQVPAGQPTTVDPTFFLGGGTPQASETRRQAYGRILTANPQFARAAVNYVWKAIFGVGIVEPADSFDLLRQDPATLPAGATLQPTHPQLLTQLASSFAGSGYDLRALIRTIVQSNAYQLSSRYTAGQWSEAWTPYYARHYPRRLMAEEVLDAVFKATNIGPGNSMTVTSATPPTVPRAMMLPDPTEGGSFRTFLNNFERGNRDDEARTTDGSIVQGLSMMNDTIVVNRIHNNAAGSTVQTLVKTNDPTAIVDGLYLATLSRHPTDAERAQAITYLKSGDLAKKTEDLQFALFNKVEFLFN
ncbi:MAG TPA: DUF1553 domain-containing protein [Thermoanaerobaculia bacterium]